MVKKKEKKDILQDKVYNFITKHPEGFTYKEIVKLLEDYPEITMEQFSEALGVNTVMYKDGETITYHCDILTAMRMCTEKRDMYLHEFD